MKLPSPETDLHIHTVASGHGFSTISEIAKEASAKGLKGVAITDHGPALPGGPHFYHFAALRFVPKYMEGVRIWRGVEANILGKGELDLSVQYQRKLDLVMAGFHEGCGFCSAGETANTDSLLSAMELPWLRVITHPGNPNFPINFEAVVAQATKTGTALEINNSSFSISRRGSVGNCKTIAQLCAEQGTRVSIGSDAHIACSVGVFTDALQACEEAGILPENIVNLTYESTEAFLLESPPIIDSTDC